MLFSKFTDDTNMLRENIQKLNTIIINEFLFCTDYTYIKIPKILVVILNTHTTHTQKKHHHRITELSDNILKHILQGIHWGLQTLHLRVKSISEKKKKHHSYQLYTSRRSHDNNSQSGLYPTLKGVLFTSKLERIKLTIIILIWGRG